MRAVPCYIKYHQSTKNKIYHKGFRALEKYFIAIFQLFQQSILAAFESFDTIDNSCCTHRLEYLCRTFISTIDNNIPISSSVLFAASS